MADETDEYQPLASRRCWHNFGCSGTGPDCAPFETADEAAQRGWNEYHAIADPAYKALKAENESLRAEVEAFREAVRTGIGPMCEDVCMRECIGPCGGAYIGSHTPPNASS